jgi:sulfite exporter TauE/SafE
MSDALPFALAAAADHAGHVSMAGGGTAWALVGALLIAGLAGGAAHCAGMCGPFVLAQTAGRLAAVPVERFGRLTRLRGALLLPYHAGRMATYAGLGAAGSALAGGLAQIPFLAWIQASLLGLAALLMLAAALEKVGLHVPKPGTAWLGSFASWIAGPLLSHPGGAMRGFALGLALGFLPCGFLYGALAAASASGEPLIGAAAMAAFALGTAPSLFAIALLGEAAGRRWRSVAGRLTPAAFAANAVLLTWMAWQAVA